MNTCPECNRFLGDAGHARTCSKRGLSPVASDPLLAMLSDEESRFRGMQKIMEQDGRADKAMQMRYIAAGIEHARLRIEHMIANAENQALPRERQ